MKRLPLILALLLSGTVFAQSWSVLSSSPSATSFRHDDTFFLTEDYGYLCNVDGQVHRTTDGGTNWELMEDNPDISFRCIGFVNAAHGWAGNLGPGRWSPTIDTMPLYETLDSGKTWTAVTAISGTLPEGICGINVVNDSVVYAVGRVGGPAYLLKTTNAGASWQSLDLSAQARDLIDCRFFSADTGFVSGSAPDGTGSHHYAIFGTVDGGASWSTVASGTDTVQLAWKLFFLTRQIGFASIESIPDHDSLPILKTTDGGLTWSRKLVSTGAAPFIQGIGFMDELHGWIGGFGLETYATTDGGDTWSLDPTSLFSLNRLRRVNDSIGYAVGKKVWKYNASATAITPSQEESPSLVAAPNPFHEDFWVMLRPGQGKHVSVRLYEVSGRFVTSFHNGPWLAQDNMLTCHLPWKGPGLFILVATTEEGSSAVMLKAE
jgi:photosystem II stability/assembly factor-like uncharacterized protein